MNIGNIQIKVIHGSINSIKSDAQLSQCRALDQDSIRAAAAGALVSAQTKGHRSLAVSDLGCEDAVFPVSGMAKIMVQEVMRYERAHPTPSLEMITFCIEGGGDVFHIFDKALRSYVRHIQEKLGPGPYVTVDIIIEVKEGIILIERSNPPYGWALPGGFLDYGESLEQAAAREAKEETDMDLVNLRQFHTYSELGRDPRFQTVSTVFIAQGKGEPKFGDDAKGLKVVSFEDLPGLEYAFDHREIIKEYLAAQGI